MTILSSVVPFKKEPATPKYPYIGKYIIKDKPTFYVLFYGRCVGFVIYSENECNTIGYWDCNWLESYFEITTDIIQLSNKL